MKKFLISSVVASALFTTAGLADISTTGTGEFLVAPQYFANGGFSTDLKLVNTSAKYSYIYRAVVREYASSNEFDFIVLLSPLDVWDASIYSCGANEYCISSTDDSNYQKPEGFTVNMTQFTQKPNNTRTFEKGYVEFYPIAAYDEGTTESTAKPVSKSKLEVAFNALVGGNTETPHGTPMLVKDGNTTGAAPALVAGFATVKNDSLKASMTIPMTAFNNVVKIDAVPSSNLIAASNNTIQNLYLADTGVKAVYNDLAVDSVTIPYEGYGVNDRPYFTFWADFGGETAAPGYQKRTYNFLVRDMKENGKEVKTDPFSGSTPDNPTYSILNEMGNVKVYSLLSAVGLNSNPQYAKGLVKLYDLTNDAVTTKQRSEHSYEIPRAIVTYMSARDVAGSPSYSWTYAPVHRTIK